MDRPAFRTLARALFLVLVCGGAPRAVRAQSAEATPFVVAPPTATWLEAADSLRSGVRTRPPGDPAQWQGWGQLPDRVRGNLSGGRRTADAPAFGGNAQVNNSSGDDYLEGQFRASVSAWSRFVVVVWEDTRGRLTPAGTPPVAYASVAYSCDWGATFVDAGSLPRATATEQVAYPCVANDGRGHFYAIAEAQAALNTSGVPTFVGMAFWSGTLDSVGCTVAWGTRRFLGLQSPSSPYPSRPRIYCDPYDDYVYLLYTLVGATRSDVVFMRSANAGGNWSSPIALSNQSVVPWNLGGDLAVRPDHSLGATWGYSTLPYFCDFSSHLSSEMTPPYTYQFSRSTTHGASWQAALNTTLPASTCAFSGGPANPYGFDRAPIPVLAADRSNGPGQGNLYMVYGASGLRTAAPGTGVTVPAAPYMYRPDQAVTLALGDDGSGAIYGSGYQDWWRIHLTAGQVLVARVEPQGYSCGLASPTYGLRLELHPDFYAPYGYYFPDSLLQACPSTGASLSEVTFTCHVDGDYYLAVNGINAAATVNYSLRTRSASFAKVAESGRDEGDILLSRSTDGGVNWSTPVLVNADSPSGYQESGQAVSVDSRGVVRVTWLDQRESGPANGLTLRAQVNDLYMAESTDQGATFGPAMRVSDESSVFGPGGYLLEPMGMRSSLSGDDGHLVAAWDAERLSTRGSWGADVRAQFMDFEPPTVGFAGGIAESTLTNASSVPLSWSGWDRHDGTGLHYAWQLVPDATGLPSDSASFTASTSLGLAWPASFGGASPVDGRYTFTLTAIDQRGNHSAAVVRHFFSDHTAPVPVFDPAFVDGVFFPAPPATVGFHATDNLTPAALVQCRIRFDGGAWSEYSGATTASLPALAPGPHVAEVQALDLAGNETAVPAAWHFTIDLVPPVAAWTQGPAEGAPSNAPSPRLGWNATDDWTPVTRLQFQRSLDGGPFSAWDTTTSAIVGPLAEGAHALALSARDAAGNVTAGPIVRSWTVDLTAPETGIVSGPGAGAIVFVSDTAFVVAGTDNTDAPAQLVFRWRLDGGAWSPPAATTGVSLVGMGEGTHVFDAQAVDRAGNADASPASRTFVVHVTPPVPAFVSAPPAFTNQPAPAIAFTAATILARGGLAYAWRVDGAPFGAFSPDTVAAVPALAAGAHTFDLRARDAYGLEAGASTSFTVDLSPPETQVTAGPDDGIVLAATFVTFDFAATDDHVAPVAPVFLTRLDGGAWSAPSGAGTVTYSGLAEGAHAFEVRSVDQAGNADPTPAQRAFTLDVSPPSTAIASGPAEGAVVAGNGTEFAFSGSDALTPPAQLRYQWALDGGAYGTPSANTNAVLTALADGAHVFRVRAVDLAGNADPQVAVRGFTVDALGPVLAVTAGPAADACIARDSTTFAWGATDAVTPAAALQFTSALDGEPFPAWSTGTVRPLAGLAEGAHALAIKVRDASGHESSLSRAWTVDETAPLAYPPTTRALDGGTVRVQCTGRDVGGLTGFRVQLAAEPTFASPMLDAVVGVDGVADYAGSPGGTYVARARAIDCAGNSGEWSAAGNTTSLANRPDLFVQQVVVPPAIVSGQTFPVTYTIGNSGLGATRVPQWSDDLVLSPTAAYDPGTAVLLARVVNQTALLPGEAYTTTRDVTVPIGTSGTQWILVLADNGDQVAENSAANNVGASAAVPVVLGDYANLVVDQVVAPPTALSGDVVTVRWIVRNTGTGRTNVDHWTDTVLLSADAALGFDVVGESQVRILDAPLGRVPHAGVLEPGQSYAESLRVALPAALGGTWHFLAAADLDASSQNQVLNPRGNVFENTQELNWAAAESTVVTLVPPPDLVAQSAAPSVGSAVSGTAIGVNWTVANGGFSAATGAWADRVWLSADAVFGGDVLLGSFGRSGPLATGAAYAGSASVTIPEGTGGDYTLFVSTDALGQQAEYREDNNVVLAGTLHVARAPWPNLAVDTGTLPDTVQAGGTLVAAWTAGNAGLGPVSATWSDDVAWSQSPVWPGSGTVLGGVRGTHTLAPDDVYGASATFAIPTSWSGRWYAYARVDVGSEVYEYSDEGDNTGPIGSVWVKPYPPVDLAATALSLPSLAVTVGQTLSADVAVTNQGQGTTLRSAWTDELWLSADASLGAGDVLLAGIAHGGALAPGAGYARTYGAVVPPVPGGDYYVIFRTDPGASTGDGNPANNLRASAGRVTITPLPVAGDTTPVALPAPDLVVQALDVPSAGTAGQPLHATWTVRNRGAGSAPASNWQVALYLSADPVLDGSDVTLGSVAGAGALAPAATAAQSTDVSLPNWVSGGFYVLALADPGGLVAESNEANNSTVSPPVTIVLPPPADLVVSDVQVPATATPGQPVSVSFTLANVGANPAVGQMQNAVYASADAAFDPVADPLVGIATMNVNLAPGAATRFSQSVDLWRPLRADAYGDVAGTLPPLTPGAYHAVVKTNIRANVRELDASNNTGVSSATLQADVPTLVPAVEQAGPLQPGQTAIYRVTVPAGQDLLFSCTSDDSNATNEMFVGFARTPSANDYDWCGPPTFTAEPQVLVPGTTGGDYYVMVVARDLGSGPASERVGVTAELLPFSIQSVAPARAGNAPQVTVRLRGAGFRDTTRVTLEWAGVPLATATAIRRINTTDMFARFDLTHVTPGRYQIVAHNGVTAVGSPAIFDVEDATPAAVGVTVDAADVLRRAATGVFTFRFTNTSNQDVPVLRARLVLPAGSTPRRLETGAGLLRRSDRWPGRFAPLAGDVDRLVRADGTDSLATIDLLAVDVPAGESRVAVLGVSGFDTNPYSVRALTAIATHAGFLADEVAANESARRWLLDHPETSPGDVLAAAADPMTFRDSVLVRGCAVPGLLQRSEVEDFLVAHAADLPVPAPAASEGPADLLAEASGPCVLPNGIPECRPDPGLVSSALPGCRLAFEARLPRHVEVASGAETALPATAMRGFTGTFSADARVVTPCDPNELVAPAGFGDQRWVGASVPLVYRVNFENLPLQTASPAQVVKVSVPLDPSLDVTTFRLGSVGFGSHVVNVGLDLTSLSIRPTYPDLGLQVLMTMGIDLATRTANWTFTSIDPATGQPPTNPYIGFLPVNDQTGIGAGFVEFTIAGRAAAATGVSIQEAATIRFDLNAPLTTASVANRLDTGRPASAVLASTTALDSTHVLVRWQGTDDASGAGLSGVTLFMRQDQGAFTAVGEGLSGSELPVPVATGHVYGFYTLARDNAGNLEADKASAEKLVPVGLGGAGVPASAPRVTFLHPVWPNPARGPANVRLDLARPGLVSLEVLDVQGRRVSAPLSGRWLAAGSHTLELKGLPRAPGVYFVRMRAPGYGAVRRMVILE